MAGDRPEYLVQINLGIIVMCGKPQIHSDYIEKSFIDGKYGCLGVYLQQKCDGKGTRFLPKTFGSHQGLSKIYVIRTGGYDKIRYINFDVVGRKSTTE